MPQRLGESGAGPTPLSWRSTSALTNIALDLIAIRGPVFRMSPKLEHAGHDERSTGFSCRGRARDYFFNPTMWSLPKATFRRTLCLRNPRRFDAP